MSDLDKILTPIEGANSCGVDLEYDNRFQELKALIEAGDAESPTNWVTVKKRCLELLGESRSVDFLVLLAVSLVATDGYQGLRDGLHVLTKSIENFWEAIYPELDMEEPEPDRYEMRLNLVAQIGEQPGKLGDKLCYVEKILRAPLSASNPRVSATFWPIWERELIPEEERDDEASGAKTVVSYMAQMPGEEKKLISNLVNESIQRLQDFSKFLMEKTGSAYNGPFDECLLPILEQISKAFFVEESESVQVSAEGSNDNPSMESVANSQNVVSASAPPPPPPGTINSREDVKKALEKIIDYYKKNEPGSVIPYLAVRTQELVDAEFIDVIRNLSKESEPQFKKALNIT